VVDYRQVRVRTTNRRLGLGSLCAALAVGAAGVLAATAAGERTAGPISSTTVADAVGDAVGAGGDLQSVTYTVAADGTLSLAATYANRSDLGAAPSTQFDIATQDGSVQANVAAFSGYPSQLSVWQNGAWVTQHQLPAGTWSGHTFTLTVALGDLQSTLHVPVTPTLQLEALSVEVVDDQGNVSTDDIAPDNGWTVISTQAQTPIATAPTTPAPTAPPTATTKTSPPRLAQATKHVRGKLEWTKLALSSVPAGARASIACTKGCHLTERLAVARGKASSKRFVHVPFARGATFVVRVVRASGSGWWWRETVAGAASGARGCVARGGKLVAGKSC
jgi:hypothetical protein